MKATKQGVAFEFLNFFPKYLMSYRYYPLIQMSGGEKLSAISYLKTTHRQILI